MTTLETLLRKIDWLRESDAELKLFGAATHRYELNPPADEELLAVEEGAGRISEWAGAPKKATAQA